jgi:hypothetical protein
MPYRVNTDANNRVVHQQVEGVYTAAELTEANALIKAIDSTCDYRMLFDLTDMRHLDVSDAHLEALGRKIHTELPVRFRAIVCGPRFLDQMRIFASHATTSFQNVQVFSDLSEACHWLLIPELGALSGYGMEDNMAEAEVKQLALI